MTPVINSRVLFVQPPTGYPQPGVNTTFDEAQTVDLENVPLNGGFLLKSLVFSIDPYIRNMMLFAYTKGNPILVLGIGVVLRTENAAVKVGDHVHGVIPAQEYSIVPDPSKLLSFKVLTNEEKLPWSAYVGVAGMPGQTSYVGWKEYASPQKDDVVFVTAGSGPVGSVVIQLAKQDGCKVIASAGSDKKVEFLKEIGADVAFNYKTRSTAEVLQEEGPVNIYWDNVGGETLDTVLAHAAPRARFIECGMISIYNTEPPVMQNMLSFIRNEIRLFGLNVANVLPKYEEQFYAEVPRWIAEGRLKYIEETRKGIEHTEQAILDIQFGKCHGKLIVSVADDV